MAPPLLGRDTELQLLDDVIFGRIDGVAFLGPAGCGKSALIDAADDRAREVGLTVHRITGSPVTRGVEFGAVAHLVPDLDNGDRSGQIRTIHRRLVDAANAPGTLLVVDDAEHLDPATIALIHGLAMSRQVLSVLTVTAGRTPVPLLYRLWSERLIERFDVRALNRTDTRTLLERALGGSVADDVERAVWDLTLGHPLYITAIAAHTRFRQSAGLWRLDGGRLPRAELAEVVEPSLEHVDPAARATLAAFAIGSPLNVDIVDLIAGPEATAHLETLELIGNEDGLLSPTHPLVALVALERLSTRDRRRIARTLAEATLANPASTDQDLVRAVIWQIEAHADIDPAVAMRAAHQALSDGDFATARDIASITRKIVTEEARWEPAFVLAQALRQLGDIGAAEIAFVEAAGARDDNDRVNVAVAHAHNLAIAGGRFPDSLAMLSELSSEIDDPVLQRRLGLERTFLSAVIGDFREIIDVAESVLAAPDLDDFTALGAANGLAFAQVMTMRLGSFDELVGRVRPTAEQLVGAHPLAVDQLDLITVVARIAQGRITDAIAACEARRDRDMDRSWGAGDGAWSSMEAFARSFRTGNEAAEVALRAVVGLQSRDPLGLRYVGTGIGALVVAQCGMLDEAREMFDGASTPSSEGERRSGTLIRARLGAWTDALAGNHTTASETVSTAGALAIEWSHVLWGSLALHDAVRFGSPHLTRGDLHRLRTHEHAGGSLLDIMCAHADALDDRDVDALLRVVDDWLGAGASLFGAETACQAASLLTEQGDDRAAARAAARAQVIGHGSLPLTPACSTTHPPLTERQSEIVLFLLDGRTARDVANELLVSTRTVENHVATVYRNLGLSSRQELAEQLRPPDRLSSDHRDVE